MRAVQLLPLFLLLSAISCAAPQTQEDPSRPPPPKTTLEVRNQKPLDFNMYVVDGTHRIRLGMVPGMSTRTFTIPHHMVGDRGSLRFQADTIGSQAVLATDEELAVHAGDAVSLTIR
jgi:P pilus assembly chaperone PapD